MRILRNYILKDFFTSFIFALLLLTMVMLLGQMVKISDMVIRQGVNIFDALKAFSLFVPYILKFTLPLAFLLGILLAMGRLITDNEITPIKMAGISIFKILNIFLMLGVIFSLFLFILNDRVIPNFHYNYRSHLKNIFSKNVSSLIEPRVSLDNFPGHILYASDKSGNKLSNVYIYELDENEETTKIIFAKKAKFITEGDTLKMILEDGFRDESRADKKGLSRLNFKRLFKDLPVREKENAETDKKNCDMTLNELRENIRKLKNPPVDMISEFHERISFSFSIIVFILLGFGVSLVVKHREKSINFGIAFLGGLGYYLLFILAKAVVEHQILSPAIGMWLPNIIIAAIGLFLLKKNAHFR